MQVLKKDIVTTLAYLTGVKDNFLETVYEAECPEKLKEMRECKKAKIVRILNMVRTTIMLNYERVNSEIRFELKNLDRMELFNADDIKWLETNNVKLLQVNSSADKYLLKTSQLIGKHINDCKDLFPEWVMWEYIKNLFVIPSSLNSNEATAIKAIKTESIKFSSYRTLYPFQTYIHWIPDEHGNLFNSDKKFLTILYQMNGSEFVEGGKVTDATEETKENIYDFIEDSDKVAIIVDCENADVYKLYSALKNLDENTISKVKKIILYDDYHTTPAWKLLHRLVNIEVERVEVGRVTDAKSLVDIKMTAGVCKEFYENKIDSFILCSSDSDFWGLISSLPDAHFIVMIEYEKCGSSIKRVLSENKIYYCSVDDFCSADMESIQVLALRGALKEKIDEFNSTGIWADLDVLSFVNSLYTTCRIEPKASERKRFIDKYINTLTFKNDTENGKFIIQMA